MSLKRNSAWKFPGKVSGTRGTRAPVLGIPTWVRARVTVVWPGMDTQVSRVEVLGIPRKLLPSTPGTWVPGVPGYASDSYPQDQTLCTTVAARRYLVFVSGMPTYPGMNDTCTRVRWHLQHARNS
eukprot:2367970-Rhodomonas_salina.1